MSQEKDKALAHSSKVEDYVALIPCLKQPSSWQKTFAQRAVTTLLLPAELQKARRLLNGEEPLKLHIGCGQNYLAGWINIDLARPGRRQDLNWDLRRGLPFPDDVAKAIFAEHFFDELDIAAGLELLMECRRVLTPGGVVRIASLDLERYANSYFEADTVIDDYRPGRPTRGIAFGEIFLLYRRRSVYDFETLELILREVGFTNVERSAFGEGRLTPSPDSEEHRPETLYVDAVK